MSNVKYILAVFVPVLACVACGEAGKSEAPSANRTAGELASMQPAKSHFAGTYERVTPELGELARLVLKTDFTYHAGRVIACAAYPCPPVEEDGTFRVSFASRQSFITLHASDGEVVSRYQYELRDSTLALRRVPLSTRENASEGRWFLMPRTTTSWCAVSSDCDLQNLPIGPCAGQWTCASSVCNYSCAPLSAK